MEEVPKGILKAVFDKVNSEDTFARLIGMKLIEVQPGFARATLPITDATINIYRMAHGERGGTLANLETSFRRQQS
jgi:acyl-coenzyme A thioesterase PaaI-like protein